MAGFVKDAEEGFVEKARIIASRDPRISRPKAAAERMRRHVESAGFKVETQRGRRGLTELFLEIDWIFSLQDVPRRLSARGADRSH